MNIIKRNIGKLRNNKMNCFKFVSILISIVLSLIFICIYITQVKPKLYQPISVPYVKNADMVTGEIQGTMSVKQLFQSNELILSGFTLQFITYDRSNTCTVNVKLINEQNGKTIQLWKLNADSLSDWGFETFKLDKPIENETGTQYGIEIFVENGSIGNTITLCASSDSTYEEGELYINHKQISGNLVFSCLTVSSSVLIYFLFFFLFTLFIFIFCIHLIIFKTIKIENAFVVISLLLGLVYIFFLPPYSSPDEARHFATSYQYSNSILGQPKNEDENFILRRKSDNEADMFGIRPNKLSYYLTINHFFDTTDDAILEEWNNPPTGLENMLIQISPVQGSIVPYLFSTLGITAARLFNWGFVPVIMSGRLFNLVCYIILCYFSIKVTKKNKIMFFIIALLPMCMEQASSYSYDATLNGLTFLAVSYILYLAYEKEFVKWKDVILLSGFGLILPQCKGIYGLVLFLIILIPPGKYQNKRMCILSNLLVISITIITTFLANISVFFPSTSSVQQVGLYSFGYILEHPLKTIILFVHTAMTQLDDYILKMFGSDLGWYDINISHLIIFGFMAILFLSISCVKNHQKSYMCSLGDKGIVSGIVLLEVFLVFLSMTMITGINDSVVIGIQGRYFIPLIPLVLLLIKNRIFVVEKDIDGPLISGAVILNLCTLTQVYSTVINR